MRRRPTFFSRRSGEPQWVTMLASAWARARTALVRRRHGLAAAALSTLVIGATLSFAAWYMARDARLGVVDFPISCGWQSQREFTRATSLLHLFEFAAAEDGYAVIAKRDPGCAMAFWGIAMSRLKNPIYALPSAEDVAVAAAALDAAAAAPVASPRERGYLAAAGRLFAPPGASGWPQREVAYAEAMASLAGRYPDDQEAAIFYALALNLAASPADKTHAQRTKAAELLLLAFAEQPDHPGIDHYLTYCLGHAVYQPKPFEKTPMSTPIQRLVLATLAVLALSGTGIFVARTAGLGPGAGLPAAIGGPFALTAANGAIMTEQSFAGRWMLVYFGYTHCPGICPITMTAIAQVLEKLGPLAEKVQPIFVTIDPDRDRPEKVDAFAKAFDSRIIGLTGSPAEIAQVAKEYRVFFKKLPASDADTYLMEHTSYVFLMSPQGRYVTLFTEDQTEAPDDMAQRLRELMTPST
jgi:protein SCO1/2